MAQFLRGVDIIWVEKTGDRGDSRQQGYQKRKEIHQLQIMVHRQGGMNSAFLIQFVTSLITSPLILIVFPGIGTFASASITSEDDQQAEDEAKVVPPAVIMHLVDADVILEQREDKGNRGNESMPQT